MKISTSMLIFSVSSMLFIGALITGVDLFQDNHMTLNKVDEAISGRDRNLVMVPTIEGDETVDGASVVQSIFHIAQLGADIQVDGLLYDKTLDIDYTDVSMINVHDTYRTEYERDSNGILQKIVFRRI